MSQIDPNIVYIPHKDVYIVEDPQRRSPSLESPRPPPITDGGATTQEHQVVDIIENKASRVRTFAGSVRSEKWPQDIV